MYSYVSGTHQNISRENLSQVQKDKSSQKTMKVTKNHVAVKKKKVLFKKVGLLLVDQDFMVYG